VCIESRPPGYPRPLGRGRITQIDSASATRSHDAPGETDWIAAERSFDERYVCSETGLGAEASPGDEVTSGHGAGVEAAGPAAAR
jgi:hypothetical protein